MVISIATKVHCSLYYLYFILFYLFFFFFLEDLELHFLRPNSLYG